MKEVKTNQLKGLRRITIIYEDASGKRLREERFPMEKYDQFTFFITGKRAGNAASTRSVALSSLDRSNSGTDSPTAPDSPRFPCDRCECADICDGPCPEYEEWEEWLVCGASKAVKGKREQHSVGEKRSDARVSSSQKTHPALDSPSWDCLWLRSECKDCYYYHTPVKSEKMPECPMGLHPKWRRLYK